MPSEYPFNLDLHGISHIFGPMDLNKKMLLQKYIRLFYSKRWMVIAIVILSVMSAVIFLQNARREYETFTTLMVDKAENGMSSQDIFSPVSSFQSVLQNHIDYIQSYSVSERVYHFMKDNQNEYPIVFEIFNPEFSDRFRTDHQRINWLRRRLSAEPLNRKSDIIKISFKAHQPEEAKFIADIYIDTYIKLNLDLIQQELLSLNSYLLKEIVDKEAKMNKAERELITFKEEQGIKSLSKQTENEIKRYADMKAQREAIQIDLEAALEAKKLIEDEIKKNQKNLSNSDVSFSSTYFNNISDRIATLQTKKLELETKLRSNNISFDTYKPTLDQYDREIKALEKQLNEKLKVSSKDAVINDPFKFNEDMRRKYIDKNIKIREYQRKIAMLDATMSKNKIETANLPTKELKLSQLERNAKIFEKTYNMLVEKKEENEIRISARKNNLRKIDAAILNLDPIYPNAILVLFGSFLGSITLSVLMILLIEYFDNSVKSDDDIKQFGLVNLGMVPAIDQSLVESDNEDETNSKIGQNGSKPVENIRKRLISHIDPNSMVAEAYRSIRTNLVFRFKQHNIKSMMLTSCGPQEGKSTTITNLGIILAQQGKKVCLIDADLRRPVLHSVFSVSKTNGITDYLIEDIDHFSIIKKTEVDNLFLITTGVIPPNPSELLSLPKIDELIEKLSVDFDLILFDTPPVIAVTDAAVLAEKVDYSTLIIRSNKTDRDMVPEAIKKLTSHNENLLGYILNDYDLERHYGYKYQYFNYYEPMPTKSRSKSKA